MILYSYSFLETLEKLIVYKYVINPSVALIVCMVEIAAGALQSNLKTVERFEFYIQ